MPMVCILSAHSHSQYMVLCAMLNLLAMVMTKPHWRLSSIFIATSMEITSKCAFLERSFLLEILHPQIPSFTETNMPNFDPVFSLLLTVTFEQIMTIKHSLYRQKVY